MSDTPWMDALDEIRRRRNQSEDPKAQQSPEDFASAQRRAQEKSLAQLEHEPERKRIAADYSKAKRTLLAATEQLRPGVRYDDDELEVLIQDTLKDLGGRGAEATVRSFLKSAAAMTAEGSRGPAWVLAEETAERLVDSGWKQVRVAKVDPYADMTPEQLAEQVGR